MRQQERRAQTTERLLDAATEVFAQVGFHAATVDDIAAAAGYTKGAVYGNFGNKASLFLALIDRHLAAQLVEVDELAAPTSAELAASLHDASKKQQDANGAFGLLMLEFWQHAARDGEARSALAARYAQIRERLSRVIAARDPAAVAADPREFEDVASLVLALDAGLFLQQMLDPDAVSSELRANAISSVIDRRAL